MRTTSNTVVCGATLGTVVLALVWTIAVITAQDRDTFDPTGVWRGPCLAKDRKDHTLRVAFTRVERIWRAKGNLHTPGYPDTDSPFEEVTVEGPRVSFIANWGPMVAEFAGVHKAGKIVGDVKIVRDGKTEMSCSWSLTRIPSK